MSGAKNQNCGWMWQFFILAGFHSRKIALKLGLKRKAYAVS
jgi:hypothetical protein